tara:strand:- start:153 stop:626 length:474 start_codon:yes stop_codon:yes gene_type:complete
MHNEVINCCGSVNNRPDLKEWIDSLKSNGLKLTKQRQAILELLHRSKHPATNREIHEKLFIDCDLASVYRAINLFIKIGLVQQFDFGDGIARFELVAPGGEDHHHHIICTQCSKVIEVDHCFPDSLSNTLAEHTGFTHITHKLEFFGICSSCQPVEK